MTVSLENCKLANKLKYKRETQDVLGRWFYPSQEFRIFFKNYLDGRIGFFLGMESDGDVKFFSPGAPI